MRLALFISLFGTLAWAQDGGENARAYRWVYADELLTKERFDEAAVVFLELAGANPTWEFAPAALMNAAVCQESTQHREMAEKLYQRLVDEYPTSKFADAALFRVALNAEKAYQFEKAIEKYQLLAKRYPASKDRENALSNLARILEALQRYDEAAVAYERYSDAYPKSEDAPKGQLRAALIYERQGDVPKEIAALKKFLQKFGRNAQLAVDAKKRLSAALERQKNGPGEPRPAPSPPPPFDTWKCVDAGCR